jgi:hypothetical protein
MYGGEKSDRAIVAMKPANKAERSAAESVERRARAEGSAVQRYTRVGHSAGEGVPSVGLLRVVDPPLPKVGAVCGKAARTVLCGGRSAMSVPTAMLLFCWQPSSKLQTTTREYSKNAQELAAWDARSLSNPVAKPSHLRKDFNSDLDGLDYTAAKTW